MCREISLSSMGAEAQHFVEWFNRNTSLDSIYVEQEVVRSHQAGGTNREAEWVAPKRRPIRGQTLLGGNHDQNRSGQEG